MKEFLSLIKEKVIIFDGAMGTSIQNKGSQITCNEYINVINPDFIQEIHADFLKSGADVIETNTFGALPYLLKEYDLDSKCEQINRAGVRLAKEVAKSFSSNECPRYVSGSIGPGTKLPSLLQVSFDELYSNYTLQAECLISEGVDLVQIETGQDPLQMKIALKAVLDIKKKYKKDTPIFLQATIQDNGQMLVGMDLLTFIYTFRDMPIHGIGINCGTGPHKIEGLVKTLTDICPLNIVILPNAGLPILKDGKLTYDLTPLEFGEKCTELLSKYRINGIGGCCGTTFDFIKALSDSVKNNKIELRNPDISNPIPYATSLFSSQEIKTLPPPLLIGERANVNGSKKFRQMLESNNFTGMVETCIEQVEEGAHVLDICLTHLDRDEVSDMASLISLLNKTVTAPLMIDSTNFQAIETALKYTSGKAIVNSVNFEHGDLKVIKYIELCRDMNAFLVCLTIDEEGMAKDRLHKIRIIERFIGLCKKHFYPLNNVFIDCLTFSLSTGDEEYSNTGKETIETLQYLKNTYPEINTVMGISNVSFGLNPKIRKKLNTVFLHECVKNGLSAAIVDASKIVPMNEIPAHELNICLDLIYNKQSIYDTLIKLSELVELQSNNSNLSTSINLSTEEQLYQSIIKGRSTLVEDSITELLKTKQTSQIINDILIPAMQEVGSLFESGKLQLPFVLKSAEIMKLAVDYSNNLSNIDKDASSLKDKTNVSILLATVQDDVHDIGKNLVHIILENNGYKVYDIGVKQTPTDIYNAIKENKPDSLGMSALLIKSTEYMKETLLFLKSQNVNIPVICGGAALNNDFVEKELQAAYNGKVVFGKDAFSALKFIQSI